MTARLAINGALLAAIAALGLAPFIAIAIRPTPFDQWYEDCAPEDADWKVVVQLGVPSDPDLKPLEAYYRKRSSPLYDEQSWSWFGLKSWFRETPQVIYLEDVWISNGGYSLAGYACGGDGGYSEHVRVWPSESERGLEVDFDYERTTNGTQTAKVKQTIAIPFRRDVAGKQGELAYNAVWTRVN